MEWLKISTSTELVRVQTDDIVFVQADGNYSDLYLFNGKPYKMTFKLHFFDEVFQKLKNNIFVRVGKSLIVNKNYIYVINITSQELLLSGSHLHGDFKLKASREALKELKALIELGIISLEQISRTCIFFALFSQSKKRTCDFS